MRDWLALRGLVAMAAVLAAALAGLGLLAGRGVTAMIAPPPEKVAEQTLAALEAHRYEGALKELSEDARQQLSPEALKQLVHNLEASGQAIADVHGLESQISGETARAVVRVKTAASGEQVLDFSLTRENGAWKLDSLEPLVRMAER